MKRATPKNVGDYIGQFRPPVQTVLKRVRRIIRAAVPGAEETISYQIPTYKLNGKPVIYFAGFTNHYSVYPSNARLVAALRKQLAGYAMSKGTIRFPLDEPVPAKLIERIAKFRAKEVAAAAKKM